MKPSTETVIPASTLPIGSLLYHSRRRRRRDVSGRRSARAEIIARARQQHGLAVLSRSPRPPRLSCPAGHGPGQPMIPRDTAPLVREAGTPGYPRAAGVIAKAAIGGKSADSGAQALPWAKVQ